MNKSELIVRLNKKTKLPAASIRQAVNAFFDKITSAIIKGDRVELRGFGTFCLHKKNARLGYNPRTGRKFFISERKLPYFRASSRLKAAMNTDKLR